MLICQESLEHQTTFIQAKVTSEKISSNFSGPPGGDHNVHTPCVINVIASGKNKVAALRAK